MIDKIIDLSGAWRAIGKNENNEDINFVGSVPGCVHTDLIQNGIIDYDIFWRDNYEKCQWIEEKNFTYSRVFVLEEMLPGAKLTFEGLDTYCDIYLNGHHVGHCDNMFISHTFPVDNLLNIGENLIEVTFYSPVFTRNFPKREGAFTTERLYTRRMQCTYGWDWVARFVTMGIFKDVYITYGNEVKVKDAYIYTAAVDSRGAQVVAEVGLENYQQGAMVELLLIAPNAEIVYSNTRYCEEQKLKEYMDIAQPQLWYPNGYGEQPLYHFCIRIDGKEAYREAIGLRTSRICCLPDKVGSESYRKCLEMQKTVGGAEYDHNLKFFGFELLVNGVSIMCKGADWVPCEPFPSAEGKEKITKILELAKAAHVNMVRVWGGGIFEQDHFYSECDRLGILVTQDFLMACGVYPEDDPVFLDALRAEAKCAALRLRNHPCLMWWTGDNENAVKGSDAQENFPGRTAALQAIFPVLRQYDPQRRFLISSPWGGDFYASKTAGTTHNSQFLGDYLPQIVKTRDYKEYLKELTARFIVEEPIFGAVERKSLLRFMTEEDILSGEEMWLSHTKTNPVLPKELFDYNQEFAQSMFGGFSGGEDRLIKLQYMQFEWVRVTLENARRNKGFCNGILYWMLNDCWPAAAGWSLIDYYNYPKAAYYSFKRCAKPTVVSVDRDTEQLLVYVSNDSVDAVTAEMTIRVWDLKTDTAKVLLQEEITCPAAKAIVTHTFPIDVLGDKELLVCELTNQDRGYYIKGNLDFVPVDAPQVTAVTENTITLRAEKYIHIVRLEGSCEFEDNYFSMLPGEERTIYGTGNMRDIAISGYSLLRK